MQALEKAAVERRGPLPTHFNGLKIEMCMKVFKFKKRGSLFLSLFHLCCG